MTMTMRDVHRGDVKIDKAAGGVVVVDLDGTIADLSHRRPYIEVDKNKDKQWDLFKGGYLKDTPITWVIEAVRELYDAGWTVLIATGREGDEQGRADTLEWLERENVPYHYFYQRKARDYRPDNEVKYDLLQKMISDGHQPTLAFDDRDRVVAMWRENGIMCVQTAEGNF